MSENADKPAEHPAANAPMIPAVETNLFNGDAVPNKIRVQFGQQWRHGQPPAWFSAVTMNLPDAISLRDLLDALIAQSEEQMVQKK